MPTHPNQQIHPDDVVGGDGVGEGDDLEGPPRHWQIVPLSQVEKEG